MRRVAVVINTRSGGLIGRERAAEEVADTLEAAGIEALIMHEGEEVDLMGRLDRAVASGADAVIVGGGDGTIAAAAQRLAGSGTALGILPLGTMNMLARDLRIPLDLDAAAETLAHGEVRTIDVAEVNGHAFLCMSVLGLPTALGRHRERHRGGTGLRSRLRLLVASVRTVLRHPPVRLRIAVDGGAARTIHTRALAVSNNAFDEGLGQMFSRARLDGGELVLHVAHRFGPWWMLRMMFAMALGTWRRQPDLEARPARAVTIGSRLSAVRVMNDGEAMLLTPPLQYTLRRLALNVIVPAAAVAGDAPETAPSAQAASA